eukprot:6262368-Amphidinium_carterae.4
MPHRAVMQQWPKEVLTVVPDVKQGTNSSLPEDYDAVSKCVLLAAKGTIKAAAVRLVLRGDSSTYRKVACTQDERLINNVMQAAARRYTINSTTGSPGTASITAEKVEPKGERKHARSGTQHDSKQHPSDEWNT